MRLEVGQHLAPKSIRVTRQTLVRYAGASGDFNPIHYSDYAARSIGQEGVIAQGLWTMGAAARIVTDAISDLGDLLEYSVRFSRPLRVPDTEAGTVIEVTAQVCEISADTATIQIEVLNAGEPVLSGAKAVVRI